MHVKHACTCYIVCVTHVQHDFVWFSTCVNFSLSPSSSAGINLSGKWFMFWEVLVLLVVVVFAVQTVKIARSWTILSKVLSFDTSHIGTSQPFYLTLSSVSAQHPSILLSSPASQLTVVNKNRTRGWALYENKMCVFKLPRRKACTSWCAIVVQNARMCSPVFCIVWINEKTKLTARTNLACQR